MLSASKLAQLNRFSTGDFCGILASSHVSEVFTKVDNKIQISPAAIDGDTTSNVLTLLTGGMLLSVSIEDIATQELLNNSFYCITYGTDFESDNIYSNELSAVVQKYTPASYTVNTFGEDDYPKFTITFNGNTINYFGKTVILNNTYIIPLFFIDSTGNVISLLRAESIESLRDNISALAIDDLIAELDSKYTHQSGSISGNTDFGKVGNFWFNSNTIRHGTHGTNIVTVDPSTHKFKLSKYTGESEGALYVDSTGNMLRGQLPVSAGGTGASSPTEAKTNLGIYFDYLPVEEFAINHEGEFNVGDLYFRLHEMR